MEKRAVWRGAFGLLALLGAFALAMALGVAAHPAKAMADESGIAHTIDSDGTYHYYSSANEAKEAGYGGATIYMDADWDLGSASLDVADSKSLTIDMCGHKITSSNKDATIYMNEHASVTITSSAEAREFKYQGYDALTIERSECAISTSGLIVNTSEHKSDGSGFHLEAGGNLTLEKIAVVGSGGEGGIGGNNSCTVSLSHVSICHNYAHDDGGGINIGSNSKLSMVASHIDDNHGSYGGGVFCGDNSTVTMEEGSTVSRNWAIAGGGFYFMRSFFTLRSTDGTGEIVGNACTGKYDAPTNINRSGGGIHVDGTMGQNQSLIEGVTISGNYSRENGGGIWLGQRWTTVRNCTITGNSADYNGGGAYVDGGNNTFENCTIEHNYCGKDGSKYEGGGIFVSYRYDVKLNGTCYVRYNTRGEGTDNADDVFLSTITGGAGKAYITGYLAEGSSVGVRTGIDGNRRVAKNFKYPSSKNCLFSDMYRYYVSYGTDEGGDAWQRNGTAEYTVQVNGANVAKSKAGSSTTVNAPSAGASKTFWYWNASATKGFDSVEKYINDTTKFLSALNFTMARNDVDLSAVYADTVTKAAIDLEAPAGGSVLPATTSFSRADGKSVGAAGEASATITWYEIVNGERIASAGRAWPGSTYVAVVSVPQSIKDGRFFDAGIGAGDISVKNGTVSSAKVDAATGTLTVEVSLKATDGAQAAQKSEAAVQLDKKDLLGSGGEATAALALSDDSQADGSDSLGKVTVSYTYNDDSDEITFAAPFKEGYNFCNWEGVGSEFIDDVSVVAIPASLLSEIGSSLTAVYTPVVTEVEFAAPAPKAAGSDLAESVSALWCTGSDGNKYNLAELVGAGSLPVSWSPEGLDGKTGYSTAYTAMVKITDEAEGLEDVDKVMGANATIKASDGTKAAGAGFTVVDGSLYLCVSFPATADVKAASVSQPSDVEITFEEAAGYAAEQALHRDALCWPLPGTVSVTLENGAVADGDVTWDIPAGFKAYATSAQEIPVKGTVSIAYPDEVDASGVSLGVTTTIKVAAPDKAAPTFPDVDYSDGCWYAEGVSWCAAHGLILGYPNGMFGVGDTMQRAQLATILWRHFEPEAEAGYDDAMATTKGTDAVDGIEDAQYYTAAANWAVEAGVVQGFEREGDKRDFAPYGDLSFEQLVSIVAKASGADYESSDLSVLDRFADKDAVSPWAAHAMAWAVEEGLVSGWDNGAENLRELKPAESVARERAAVVLANAFSAGVLK